MDMNGESIFQFTPQVPRRFGWRRPSWNYRLEDIWKKRWCMNITELTETEAFLHLWLYFRPCSNSDCCYLTQDIIIYVKHYLWYREKNLKIPSFHFCYNKVSCVRALLSRFWKPFSILTRQNWSTKSPSSEGPDEMGFKDTFAIIGTEDLFWATFLFLQQNKCYAQV